jgi:hypothetical protein
MQAKRYVALFIILPLLVGLLIYLYFRENTLLHQWIGCRNQASSISITNGLLHLVAYQLPDFCWSISFASALFLFQYHFKIEGKGFFYFVMALIVSTELVQLLVPQLFTFDWWDLIAAITAVLLSYWAKPNSYATKS